MFYIFSSIMSRLVKKPKSKYKRVQYYTTAQIEDSHRIIRTELLKIESEIEQQLRVILSRGGNSSLYTYDTKKCDKLYRHTRRCLTHSPSLLKQYLNNMIPTITVSCNNLIIKEGFIINNNCYIDYDFNLFVEYKDRAHRKTYVDKTVRITLLPKQYSRR